MAKYIHSFLQRIFKMQIGKAKLNHDSPNEALDRVSDCILKFGFF